LAKKKNGRYVKIRLISRAKSEKQTKAIIGRKVEYRFSQKRLNKRGRDMGRQGRNPLKKAREADSKEWIVEMHGVIDTMS